MANELISEATLFETTGFRDRATLRAWLEKYEIKYLPGKRGAIVTTLDAINNALGITIGNSLPTITTGTIEIN